jgi:predicted DNA-binding transcriptional regulator AlpA
MVFHSSDASPNTILSLAEVRLMTALSRSILYLRIAKGEFPHQVSLSDPAVAGSKVTSRIGSTGEPASDLNRRVGILSGPWARKTRSGVSPVEDQESSDPRSRRDVQLLSMKDRQTMPNSN